MKDLSARSDRHRRTVPVGAPAGSFAELVRRVGRLAVGLVWAAVAALVVTGSAAFLTSFEGVGAFAMVVGTAVLVGAVAALPFVVVRAVVAVLVRLEG